MKRTFLAKRNALLSSRSVSWGVGALLVSFFFLFIRLIAPNLFLQVWSPVFRMGDGLSSQSHAFLSSFSDAANLTIANEKLVSENAALSDKNQALMLELASLSALAGTQKDLSGILAGVITRPPESPYDTLVVAAGEKANISPGMEAFGNSDSPIGFVSSVSGDFSRVTLFSTPGMETNAWVGHANVPLMITGAGAGTFEASVARSANIVLGDVVSVSGPGMLPIGSVVRIDSDPLSPAVTLRILPTANPFSIAWVTLRVTGAVPVVTATSTKS